MNWETLLCLGDSITIGSRSYMGYPEYCGDSLSEKTKKSWNIINHAVAGYTTIDLVRSMDRNMDQLRNVKPEMISILIGTNDLKPPTSLENFRIAYEQILVKSRLIVGNKNIILIEIPDLREGIMLPYKLGMNKLIFEYNEIIREFASRDNLILHKMKCEDAQFFDGVHLNEEGSKDWGGATVGTYYESKILNVCYPKFL